MKKKLVILGSTGSIGVSALDVVAAHSDKIEVLGLSAHSNIDLLKQQVEKYRPKFVTFTDSQAYRNFKAAHKSGKTELLDFDKGIEWLVKHPDVDIVLNAIVGAAGLEASLFSLQSSKRLALANKESMVAGGDLINALIDKTGGEIIPVDSEHSAIFQTLRAGKQSELKKIILTGSGGPFRTLPLERFDTITREQALNHPTWNMGPKITVDSATMMNKGLEVIEAVQLFGVGPDKIEVVIHPESIIHSMVEFLDSSVIAHLSNPDMRLPIAYSFFYPERVDSEFGQLDFSKLSGLTFEKADFEKFPLLGKAFEIARIGGTLPAVYNAANEIAVSAFLEDNVEFCQIPDIVINTVEKHKLVDSPSYNDILEADRWARKTAKKMIG
jgi:1-deoxy-D-xylulose-5-phosphate reductoisomerase